MALIKCPECKKKISDQCGNCPHCGFPIENATKSNNSTNEVIKTSTEQKNKTPIYKKVLGCILYPIALIIDLLSDSILGLILGLLFGIALLIGFIIFIAWFLDLLMKINPIWAILVIAVGCNIVSFFASFVWKMRKKWFFPLTLILTLIALAYAIPAFL